MRLLHALGKAAFLAVGVIFMLLMFLSGQAFSQNATPAPFMKPQWFTSSGAPAAGYLMCTFSGGTSSPLASYTDATAGTPNSNPVVLDSAGRANIFLMARPNDLHFGGGLRFVEPIGSTVK